MFIVYWFTQTQVLNAAKCVCPVAVREEEKEGCFEFLLLADDSLAGVIGREKLLPRCRLMQSSLCCVSIVQEEADHSFVILAELAARR